MEQTSTVIVIFVKLMGYLLVGPTVDARGISSASFCRT